MNDEDVEGSWWVDDEYVLDERGAIEFYENFLSVPATVYMTGVIGVSGGTFVAIVGSLHHGLARCVDINW